MRAGTHVTLPYYWDMRSAGTYNTHHFSFHLHGWHTHPWTTPMNIHTSHVMTIHTLSTIRHYSFPLAVNPVNCYVAHNITIYMCYIDSLICFVDLNFFFYIFRLQCFHWPISFSTIFVMFIFRFILFMFGPTCASNITFYFFSGHNCISTKML